MNKLIEESLNKRYATKVFNSEKKISEKDLHTLIESVRLAPSSYGLQLIKLVLVEDKTLREKLFEFSFFQKQIIDASHLIVLCREEKFNQKHIDDYVENISKTRNIDKNELSPFKKLLEKTKESYTEEKTIQWMEKQVYIALGNLLTACSILHIDACPIEGFINNKYDEILQLRELGLCSTLVIPIGYRDEFDKYSKIKKVRRLKKDFVIIK